MNALEQYLFEIPESMHDETKHPFRAGYKAGFEAAVNYFHEQLRVTLGADEIEAELKKLRKLGLEAYDPTGSDQLARRASAALLAEQVDPVATA